MLWLLESPTLDDLVKVLVAVQLIHMAGILCSVVRRQKVAVDAGIQRSHALVDIAIALSSGSITVLPRLAMSDSQYGLFALLLRFVAPIGAARQVIEPLLTARSLTRDSRPQLPAFSAIALGSVSLALLLAFPLRLIAGFVGLEGSETAITLSAFFVLLLACMEATASFWRGPILASKELLFGLALREIGLASGVIATALAFRLFEIDGFNFLAVLAMLELTWLYFLSRLATSEERIEAAPIALTDSVKGARETRV